MKSEEFRFQIVDKYKHFVQYFPSVEEFKRYDERQDLIKQWRQLFIHQTMLTDNYDELKELHNKIIDSFKSSIHELSNQHDNRSYLFDLINEFHDCVIKGTLSVYAESNFIDEILKNMRYV